MKTYREKKTEELVSAYKRLGQIKKELKDIETAGSDILAKRKRAVVNTEGMKV